MKFLSYKYSNCSSTYWYFRCIFKFTDYVFLFIYSVLQLLSLSSSCISFFLCKASLPESLLSSDWSSNLATSSEIFVYIDMTASEFLQIFQLSIQKWHPMWSSAALEMLFCMPWLSVYLSYWFLLISLKQSSWYQQGILPRKCFLVFRLFSVNPRGGCGLNQQISRLAVSEEF